MQMIKERSTYQGQRSVQKKEEERKKDRDENISIKKDKFTSSLTRGLAS
jgi:hypothetical protein